jgi:hypothetical protein
MNAAMQNPHSDIREFPELAKETLVPLAKLGEHYPVPISRPSSERLWRKGRFGIRLETIFLNGKRYTSVEAINRYINRTQRTGDEVTSVAIPSMSKRDLDTARQKFNMPQPGRDGTAGGNN